MKKTLTINLGGIVFPIDEDAYLLLDNYLSNLRIHFSREEGTDEIMDDFETRISDLLNERMCAGIQVITVKYIEEVIKRMGQPEEILNEEETDAESEKRYTMPPPAPDEMERQKKRLMRDPDHRILGGVAGGLAAYWGIDVTIVRLVMIVLLFIHPFSPFVTVAYIVMWIVMPLAKTAADKLIMRGERVNLENLGKTVTDSFEKISSNVNDYIRSDQSRSTFRKILDFFVSFMGVLLKAGIILVTVLIAFLLLCLVVSLLLALFAIVLGIFSIPPVLMEQLDFLQNVPQYTLILGCTGLLLLLSIPLVALIYTIFGNWLHFKPIPTGIKWALLILWFISLIYCAMTLHFFVGTNAFSSCPVGVWP
ncbi:MAG: PspC domain-containing protein [Tannerella sp.]|jgi:phage shock protein PspC (stress-responsive transcriptional regulator)|nr:PspC domain-containing protein [Tannerella sp.]